MDEFCSKVSLGCEYKMIKMWKLMTTLGANKKNQAGQVEYHSSRRKKEND